MDALAAQQLWEAALGELQLQVTRPNFETWLRSTTGLRYSDSLFVVGVANDFAREWLAVKLRPLIAQTLSRLVEAPVEVTFELTGRQGEPRNGPPSVPATNPGEESPAIAPPLLRPRLHEHYTFQRFVVGSGNRLAHAAAVAVADAPDTIYNPLFLYGGVGMGKTHLLHAIGHRALERDYHVLYITSEQFTNEFVAAIAQGKTEAFRRKYRQVQVLLIDDIQFLAGKERTQEEFFYTFNDLHAAGSQIVITSDRPPRHISLLEDRLRSRCEWGLIADIQPPDLETRQAILRAKVAERGMTMASGVMELLAQQALDSVRELEGLLNRVGAYARLVRVPTVDLKVAQEALAALDNQHERPRPSPEAILQTVADHFHLRPEALRGQGRQKLLAEARHIAMYLMHRESQQSLSDIARFLSQRHHSTILHGVQKVEASLASNSSLQRHFSHIRKALYTS
ncbi:MAG: chromosomal replication initiator protein DnaA [Dehalococcoidia bacterium]